jgi:trigger factor
VEVKPRVEPRDYKGLEVVRRPAAVGEALLEEELGKLREATSRLEPVEREARDGDYALVDHEATAEGQPFEGGKAEGVTVRVAEGDFFAGFFPQLAGKRVGETEVVEISFPADFRLEALRGKRGRFVVTLRELREKRTPDLDDAFARSMKAPGVETLDQLRADLRRRLEERERARERAELHDGLVKAALARNEFEVPPALVERAIDALLEGASERFARQGIDLRQLDLDAARLRAGLREQALTQVRGALLLEAVAEAEKIDPSEPDLEAEVARIAAEGGVAVEKLRPQLRSEKARAALRNKVREDQVLAFLASHAKISDGEGPK